MTPIGVGHVKNKILAEGGRLRNGLPSQLSHVEILRLYAEHRDELQELPVADKIEETIDDLAAELVANVVTLQVNVPTQE